jgi:hypothetical protein
LLRPVVISLDKKDEEDGSALRQPEGDDKKIMDRDQ